MISNLMFINFLLFYLIVAINLAPSIILSWLLLREIVVFMYATTLHEDALLSAQAISNGQEYCLVETESARYIEELDARGVIVDAFHDRFIPARHHVKPPHFGIKVGQDVYYWSISERGFYKPHDYIVRLFSNICLKDYPPTRQFGQYLPGNFPPILMSVK
ncbi:hypothetical protein [Pseudohongiella nitratireducens]|uniref:hypothetical protein n=1 Tax=Pseudohongiella nitratireducens TaxID=1768907 RepID=UPI0030EED98D|tara:strand:+ start:20013 stop:20495 length:483 start_codon:yes stop_codon:yes gene_type:complete